MQISSDTYKAGGQDTSATCGENQISSDPVEEGGPILRGRIPDYFKPASPSIRTEILGLRDKSDMDYYAKKAKSSRNLTQSIKNNFLAGTSWLKLNKRREKEREIKAEENF